MCVLSTAKVYFAVLLFLYWDGGFQLPSTVFLFYFAMQNLEKKKEAGEIWSVDGAPDVLDWEREREILTAVQHFSFFGFREVV